MRIASHRTLDRLHRRRRAEAGLTLIELLISLMLLVLITGFLAGGLSIGRRAFSADLDASVEAANATALDSLAGLIAAALPTKVGQGFEGGRDSLAFVALSVGHALPGGPTGTRIYRDGTDVGVVVKAGGRAAAAKEVRTKALIGVTSLEFTYFGTLESGKPPAWYAEWPSSDHLPDLVGIKVKFNGRSQKPPILVALRQN